MWRSALVFVAACSSAADGGTGNVQAFAGVYTTTSHTRAEMPGTTVSCMSVGQPVTGAAPYFRLAVDESLDPGVLTLSNCTDAAATMCHDTLVTLRACGPGLQDESANTQTGGGTMCQLYYTLSQATLNGGTIAIGVLSKFDAPSISSSDCTLQRAQALASSPDCRSVERWAGTRQ